MLSYTEPAVTPAEADAYATARGWADWTGSESDKTAALRRGQDYIAGLYNDRWSSAWDNDDAPENVKFAVIEAARRELVSPGSLTPDVTKTGSVSRKKVKAGPVETETQYAELESTSDALPVIVAIERLLAGLIASAGGAMTTILRY